MKTAISIPDQVFRSADSLARRLGISRSQLYSTAVSEFLSRHRGTQITERLDAVYATEESTVPSGLLVMQAGSLPPEEW